MYTAFFGFERKPFKPKDLKDFYRNANFDAACADVLDSIRERRGFALLTGESGVGKTCLLRRCMAEADDIRFVLLTDPNLDFPDLLQVICSGLNLPAEPDEARRQHALLEALTTQARRHQTIALVIDDAHRLRVSVLGRLWDFVQIPVIPGQRLQVVLAGLPDIEGKLRQPELQALREGILTRCRIDRLSETEVGLYLTHQLAVAGNDRRDLIAPAAIERIAYHSRGTLRAIAVLGDAILLLSSLYSERQITPDLVDEAALNCFIGDRPAAARPAAAQPVPALADTVRIETTPALGATSVVSVDFDLDLPESSAADAMDLPHFDFGFDFDLEETATGDTADTAPAPEPVAPVPVAPAPVAPTPAPPAATAIALHLGEFLHWLDEITEKRSYRAARDRAALRHLHNRYLRLAHSGPPELLQECEQRLARLSERPQPVLVSLAAAWPASGSTGVLCALLLNPGWWQCREIRLRWSSPNLRFANNGQLPPLRLLDGRDAQPLYLSYPFSGADAEPATLTLELDLRDHRGEWHSFDSPSIDLDFSATVAKPAGSAGFWPEPDPESASAWAGLALDGGRLAGTLLLELTANAERTGALQAGLEPGEGFERGAPLTRALLLAADPAYTPARIELVSRPFMVFGRHGADAAPGFGDFTLGFVPDYNQISRLHCVICALGDQLALMPASDQGPTYTGRNGRRLERGRWEALATNDDLEIGHLYRLKLTLAWDRKGESEALVWDTGEPRDKFGRYLLDLIEVLRQRDRQTSNDELRTTLGLRYARLLQMQDRVAALNGVGNPGALIYARFERDDEARQQIIHYYVPKWLSIGNSTQAGLRIDAPDVAPRHADLLFRDGMYWIQNLAAPGSVQVGCHPLATNETLALEVGDELTIGSAHFTLEAY